ncbi:VOC family protein [Nostoc edaphicum]|uniref:VOC family protein n=1 Tax=Nostoc edaphicum TaxID=264686 RepID=UPI001EECC0F3|nr:VOC family protein [Nostoc edaphicum]
MDSKITVQYPRSITHVGVTVTDLDKAVEWYQAVLGLYTIAGPHDLVADDSHFGKICSEVFGADFKKCRLVHMGTGNQVTLAIFEFNEPKAEPRDNNFEYWKNGFFQICIIDPDVEALAKRIEEHGGKQRTKVWELFEGSGYKLAFCQDPFGNILEIYSHSAEQFWSNR